MMKRVYKFIGVSALFLKRDALASPEFNKASPNINLPFDAKEDVESSSNKTSMDQTSRPSIPSTSLGENLNPVKPKKRTKKETAQKKKPTISKTTRSKAPSSSVSSSKSSATVRRIKKEYEDAVSMGICYDWAKQKLVKPKKGETVNQEYQKIMCVGPLVSNLRHWHFSFRGCGIYKEGIYHGRIILPKDYPSTPPRVQLWTPSGRFIPMHDICLSASSYHPESWTPRWTVLSLVQALRLHMLTNPQEIGGKLSSLDETQEYAKASLTWWAQINAGKRVIEINHELLLRQKVLSLLESEEKNSGEEPNQDTVVEAKTEPEPKTQATPETLDPRKEPLPHSAKSESSQLLKPKKKRKSKKHGRAGSMVVQKPPSNKEVSSQYPVLTVLAKLIGSPFRLGLFSLLLLFWLTSFISP